MSNKHIQIYLGDSLTVLKTLPSESVQTVVTSPPYFGLRDYKIAGQIGAERTPEEYIAALATIFAEVYRVMKTDATCWLNIGDSYANDKKWGGSTGNKHAAGLHGNTGIGRQKNYTGLKPKELIGVPWSVAFALRAVGFFIRQDIIWHKRNPMPESVKDRCTKAHEYIFLLTKSANYYYDHEAIKEPAAEGNWQDRITKRQSRKSFPDAERNGIRSWKGSQFHTGKTAVHQLDRASKNRDRSLPRNRNGLTGSLDAWAGESRNKRSVWSVPTQPFKEAHFAVFPEKLIEPCILAGSREGDIVLDPFLGAGTTGVVALKNKRRIIGIELNPSYIEIAGRRINGVKI